MESPSKLLPSSEPCLEVLSSAKGVASSKVQAPFGLDTLVRGSPHLEVALQTGHRRETCKYLSRLCDRRHQGVDVCGLSPLNIEEMKGLDGRVPERCEDCDTSHTKQAGEVVTGARSQIRNVQYFSEIYQLRFAFSSTSSSSESATSGSSPGSTEFGSTWKIFLISKPNYFRKSSRPTRSDTHLVRHPGRQHRRAALLGLLAWTQPRHLLRLELQLAD